MHYNNENNAAIADELEDIALQLSMLDTDNVNSSLATINTELSRIDMLSQLLEAEDLRALTHWMQSNTTPDEDLDNDKENQIKTLLQAGHYANWIDILAAILREPDPSLLSALDDALTEPNWPSKIPSSLLNGVTEWLINGDATDLSDSSIITSTINSADIDGTVDLHNDHNNDHSNNNSDENKLLHIFEDVDESILSKNYDSNDMQASKELAESAIPTETPLIETEKTSYNLIDSATTIDGVSYIDELLTPEEKGNLQHIAALQQLTNDDLTHENSDNLAHINIATDVSIDITDLDTNPSVESEQTNTENSNDFSAEVDNIIMTLSTTSPTPEAIFEHTEIYINELQRLDLLAEFLGYSEIAKASTWCQKNITLFAETKTDAARDFINSGECWSWIKLSNACLTNPDDISLLPAVSAELMRDEWLEPLATDDLQSLIMFLQNPDYKALMQANEKEKAEQPAENEQIIKSKEESGPTLKWDEDVHPELLDVYFQETPDQITEVASLLQVISQGNADKEQHQSAARIAHTIKGASGVVGITALVEFTHKLEDILDYSVVHKLPSKTSELLAEASDCLESLFEAVQDQQAAPDDFMPILEKLEETAESITQNNIETEASLIDLEMPELPDFIKNQNITNDTTNSKTLEQTESLESLSNNNFNEDLEHIEIKEITEGETSKDPLLDNNTLKTDDILFSADTFFKESNDHTEETTSTTQENNKSFGETHIRVPVSIIDKLLNLAGELSITSSQVSDQLEKTLETSQLIKSQDSRIHEMLEELTTTISKQEKNQVDRVMTQQDNHFDTLEMDSYNELHSITSLLTESILDSEEIENNLNQQLKKLNDHLRTQDNLNKELSAVILNSRMVSINTLVPRLERIVRQTCRKTEKQAELVITGNNIHIDTDIISGLADPLLHLLRNAVDHGIETTETRKQNNKVEKGIINLDFSRQGNFIVMQLKDDGAGINPDKVYQRAIEKGLITPEQEFSKDEVLRLILQAGFTTQDSISNISGRGVGMDVVKTNVEKLKGSLELESTVKQGTTFTIKIPLTLVTSGTLLLSTSGNHIAIPVDSIDQLTYLSPDKVISKGNKNFIRHENKHLLIQSLSNLLGWPANEVDFTEAQSLLIVKSNNKLHAIHVDEIINSREVVIKSLSPWLNTINGIIGACHLADGAVAPVINLPQLLEVTESVDSSIKKAQQLAQESVNKSAETPQILVVDDSLSNRKALSLIIEQSDYDVITAVDGLDALNIINEKHIDMIFTDLEMPRMNGLELTQAIRAWDGKKELPIVMVTSRTTSKHRQLAVKAGVDDYLTKPVITEALQDAMQKWLKTSIA